MDLADLLSTHARLSIEIHGTKYGRAALDLTPGSRVQAVRHYVTEPQLNRLRDCLLGKRKIVSFKDARTHELEGMIYCAWGMLAVFVLLDTETSETLGRMRLVLKKLRLELTRRVRLEECAECQEF